MKKEKQKSQNECARERGEETRSNVGNKTMPCIVEREK